MTRSLLLRPHSAIACGMGSTSAVALLIVSLRSCKTSPSPLDRPVGRHSSGEQEGVNRPDGQERLFAHAPESTSGRLHEFFITQTRDSPPRYLRAVAAPSTFRPSNLSRRRPMADGATKGGARPEIRDDPGSQRPPASRTRDFPSGRTGPQRSSFVARTAI